MMLCAKLGKDEVETVTRGTGGTSLTRATITITEQKSFIPTLQHQIFKQIGSV